MASFRTWPLDLATEADFGALGRLPRQDLVHIKPHLLAASTPFTWHAVIYVSFAFVRAIDTNKKTSDKFGSSH
jgi:hypothetical protein